MQLLPARSLFGRVLGHFGLCVPSEKESPIGPKWVKHTFSKSDPEPLGVPVNVFGARFEAYLGHFDRPYVPKSLKGEPFGDQRRVKSGPKMWFSGCALGPTGVLRHIFSPFGDHFELFGPPVCPSNVQKGPKCTEVCHRNKRMWQKYQQMTADSKIDCMPTFPRLQRMISTWSWCMGRSEWRCLGQSKLGSMATTSWHLCLGVGSGLRLGLSRFSNRLSPCPVRFHAS